MGILGPLGSVTGLRFFRQLFRREWESSPPSNCSHEALPFVEAPAKAQLTRGVETQPCVHLAVLTTFRVVKVPIMTARNKDVRRERVAFGFHCRKLALNVTYRRSESFQCVLKACGTHGCSTEHIGP